MRKNKDNTWIIRFFNINDNILAPSTTLEIINDITGNFVQITIDNSNGKWLGPDMELMLIPWTNEVSFLFQLTHKPSKLYASYIAKRPQYYVFQ